MKDGLTKENSIEIGNLFHNPVTQGIVYVADFIDDKFVFLCKNSFGHISLINWTDDKNYVPYQNSKVKTAFKNYYKDYVKREELILKMRELEQKLFVEKKTIEDLIFNDLPTIKNIVEKVNSRSDCEINSYSTYSEGELTVSKSNFLGKHRSDLASVSSYEEASLLVDENTFYQKYAPAKKQKQFFSNLKSIKLMKISNNYSVGDKLSVYAETNYTFKTKVTKRNKDKVLEEVQWVVDNL